MHVHVSTLTALATFLQVIIVGFLWRALAVRIHDTPIGKAMAFIY
jgi:hypothetical protein